MNAVRQKAKYNPFYACPFCNQTTYGIYLVEGLWRPKFSCGYSGELVDFDHKMYDVYSPCKTVVKKKRNQCKCDKFTLKYDGCQCK